MEEEEEWNEKDPAWAQPGDRFLTELKDRQLTIAMTSIWFGSIASV
jgi:hypothetical protein